MSTQQIDTLTEEINTANNHLVQLDDTIKGLQEQYARIVLVVDAFEQAKKLLEQEAENAPKQMELPFDEEE